MFSFRMTISAPFPGVFKSALSSACLDTPSRKQHFFHGGHKRPFWVIHTKQVKNNKCMLEFSFTINSGVCVFIFSEKLSKLLNFKLSRGTQQCLTPRSHEPIQMSNSWRTNRTYYMAAERRHMYRKCAFSY